ncbi:MerR family transcriptional regulator [Foetidibacter luteolus]|uniref:MerR family transcriptional regulator n=1 Tax=Foetidibacter luteolus TaxID=2608880 RepID=UPI00129BA14E|nr:MerR family transcriptional regulator [Foetidibacter luteolus]
MNAFTIRDLENLSGIKAHTLRIWEQRYAFLRPKRTDTNIRLYSNDELKTILNISLLNRYGYKVSHINRMTELEIKEKIRTLSHAQALQERVINELIQLMIDLQMDEFESRIDDYIYAHGIEKAINQLIFPFLERIGILWLTNNINPAQEHLVSNLIRQKLIVGIEETVSLVQVNKTVLLFLPEGEHHEIGLLYMYYLLKTRGIKVLYIGANTPLKDIEYVTRLKQPDYLYTHLTSVSGNFNFEKFAQSIASRLPASTIIVSGRLTKTLKSSIPAGIKLKTSLQEVMEYIASLQQ